MNITTLGEPLFDSPLSSHVSDKARVLFNVIVDPDAPPSEFFIYQHWCIKWMELVVKSMKE